jgi:hypothetical protein
MVFMDAAFTAGMADSRPKRGASLWGDAPCSFLCHFPSCVSALQDSITTALALQTTILSMHSANIPG